MPRSLCPPRAPRTQRCDLQQRGAGRGAGVCGESRLPPAPGAQGGQPHTSPCRTGDDTPHLSPQDSPVGSNPDRSSRRLQSLCFEEGVKGELSPGQAAICIRACLHPARRAGGILEGGTPLPLGDLGSGMEEKASPLRSWDHGGKESPKTARANPAMQLLGTKALPLPGGEGVAPAPAGGRQSPHRPKGKSLPDYTWGPGSVPEWDSQPPARDLWVSQHRQHRWHPPAPPASGENPLLAPPVTPRCGAKCSRRLNLSAPGGGQERRGPSRSDTPGAEAETLRGSQQTSSALRTGEGRDSPSSTHVGQG